MNAGLGRGHASRQVVLRADRRALSGAIGFGLEPDRISEVAFEMGFQSLTYFQSCLQENCPPVTNQLSLVQLMKIAGARHDTASTES